MSRLKKREIQSARFKRMFITTLCFTLLRVATCRFSLLHVASVRYTLLHFATLCHTLPHFATFYYTLLLFATRRYTSLHFTGRLPGPSRITSKSDMISEGKKSELSMSTKNACNKNSRKGNGLLSEMGNFLHADKKDLMHPKYLFTSRDRLRSCK